MEYVVGPVLALLLGFKITAYKVKKAEDVMEEQYAELVADVEAKLLESSKETEAKILENNGVISQQTRHK